MHFLDTLDGVDVLIICALAVLLGVWLAKKQAKAFQGEARDGYAPVTFSDYADMRFLHLGSPAVQGSMKLSQPFDLHLDYVQRMMAWLLFVDIAQVHTRKAMQLGLGAGSLTKFCYTQLGMHTTAVEVNPHVIDTCRRWFHLPPNSARLHVVQDDAARIAEHPEWQGQVDVLQVDLYDAWAQRPVLDSASFYRDCRGLLTPTGCLVVNVFGQASDLRQSVATLQAIFGDDAVWAFTPTTAGNAIVLAFCTPVHPDASHLQAQARHIEARWPWPASKWLHALTPVTR